MKLYQLHLYDNNINEALSTSFILLSYKTINIHYCKADL